MKLAIVGKGGAGKTTLAATLARRLAAQGQPVIAVDADPDGNLAAALGVPADQAPAPIAQMRGLVLERTEAKDQGAGLMYKLNPAVADLPDRFAVNTRGVRLLALGTVESGGQGCMCPEATLLKALLQHLLLRLPDAVILDMEAGLEHLGRASARGVDALLAVVEPGMRSVQTATRAARLAADIGIQRTLVVVNKIRAEHEVETLRQALGNLAILGALPYSAALARADLEGQSADVDDSVFRGAVERLSKTVEEHLAR